MIAGDFNARNKILDKFDNIQGTDLADQISMNNTVLLAPDSPTTTRHSTIDLIIIHPGLALKTHINQITELRSDHLANHRTIENKNPRIKIIKYKKLPLILYSQN